jgi:sugar transferase (PEP-CTERM/EpsH1 system associated)
VNVLFLTHRLPYAPNRGDRIRAYFLLKHLSRFATVDVVSLVHDTDEAGQVSHMKAIAASVSAVRVPKRRNMAKSLLTLPTARPTTHTMLTAPGLEQTIRRTVTSRSPDVVLAYCSGTARWALDPPLAGLPFVLDMVDVDSAKWRDLSRVTRPPLGWIYRREARVLSAFEVLASTSAAATMVVTSRERDTLRALAPTARVEVVPNGVDVDAFRPLTGPAATANVVFCGVMNYAPNEHAALLLGREVWPLVRASRPDATLTIVGSEPTPSVQALAAADASITVTGAVPDVKPYLWQAAVAAAPIATARGIQNKVLEAVAAGLPTVVTPNIATSLPAEVLPAIRSGTGAADIAAAILSLLELSPEARRSLAARADVSPLSWNHQLAPVRGLLEDAVARRRQ